jgi:hypothetical protein
MERVEQVHAWSTFCLWNRPDKFPDGPTTGNISV